MLINIIFALKNGQQIIVGEEEINAAKTVKKMREDLWGKNPVTSLCIQDYIESKDPNTYMVIDAKLIGVITLATQPSDIELPKKNLIFAGSGKAN